MAYCPECGHHNRESARFCGRCGASLLEPDVGGEPTQAFAAYVEEEGDADTSDVASEGAMLVIRIGGGRAGEQFSINADRMAIGRAPSAEVFLDDITVSREHAVLERRDDGLHLSDSGSLNGTYVNRQRIESVRLADGDEVQIGKYRLTYIERGS
jgi:pSer/pThr/pTyr-binding forkhead associated (FHA) protein